MRHRCSPKRALSRRSHRIGAVITTTTGPAGRVVALASAEVKLLVRNRTATISSLFLPVAFGVFFAFTYGSDPSPQVWGLVVALQLRRRSRWASTSRSRRRSWPGGSHGC